MKVDLKKELDCYRATRDEPRLLTVPDLQYLMIDGAGEPNSAAFAEAITTIYPVAYAVKFASKTELGRDYVVMPLEGLWWSDDMATFTSARDKSRWQWTLAVLTPEWIDSDLVDARSSGSRQEGARPARGRPAGDPVGGPVRAGPARRVVRRRGRPAPPDAPRVHPRPGSGPRGSATKSI